jgi:hypothetical protein
MLSIVPPSGLAEEKDLKDEETLKKAAVVLQGILSRKDAPLYGLEKADCIVVQPDGGRGVMSWAAPAAPSVARGRRLLCTSLAGSTAVCNMAARPPISCF